jgi:hypothetical protein
MNENQPVTAGMDKVLLVTNSVVVQDNTGIRERSSGTSFCESVGSRLEPARPVPEASGRGGAAVGLIVAASLLVDVRSSALNLLQILIHYGTLCRLFRRGRLDPRATKNCQNRSMEIGEEWIYRLTAFSSSERVRILDIEKRKQTTRVDIEFLDGERAGRRENVPGTRLHGLWARWRAMTSGWPTGSGSAVMGCKRTAGRRRSWM